MYLHLQESLQALTTLLNDFIGKAVGEDLSREWRDIDAGGLSLQDVPEPFKVRVAAADSR